MVAAVGEEPSNADLARQLAEMREDSRQQRAEEREYHTRSDARFDSLVTLVTGLQRQQEVDRVKTEAALKTDKERLDAHEQHHREEAKAEEKRKSRSSTTLMVVGGLLTGFGSVASAAVVLLLH